MPGSITLELSKKNALMFFYFIYKMLALFRHQFKIIQFKTLEFCNKTALHFARVFKSDLLNT
jgi:hypothetical protein